MIFLRRWKGVSDLVTSLLSVFFVILVYFVSCVRTEKDSLFAYTK